MISEFFRNAYVIRLVFLSAVVGAFGIAIWIGLIKPEYIGMVILIIAALLLLLGGAAIAFRWLDRARSSRTSIVIQQGLSKFMRSRRAAMTPEEEADHQELAKKLEDGLDKLRQTAESLAKVPFVIIIGEPGGGKTRLIKESGIEFEKDLNDELAGTGGTRGMDWWFTPDQIIIDTAGKATVSEADRGASDANSRPADNPLWTQILQFLREARPRCPINSILIALPMRSLLLDDDEELRRKAQHLSRSLALLQDHTGVRCPVSVVITMSDLLPGYREFVGQHRERNAHTQMLGWSNPRTIDDDVPFDPKSIESHCAEVADRLGARRLAILNSPSIAGEAFGRRRIDGMDGLYTLPHGLRMIAPRVRECLSIIFSVRQSSYLKNRRPPFLRGLYFASSCQEGGTIDPEVARLLGVDSMALAREDDRRSHPMLAARSNGIQDLFNEKIFKETGLVTAAPHVRTMIRRRNAALIAAVGVAAVFVGLLGYGMSVQPTKIAERATAVGSLNQALAQGFTDSATVGNALTKDSTALSEVFPSDAGSTSTPRPLAALDWVKGNDFEPAAERFAGFLSLAKAEASNSNSASADADADEAAARAMFRTNDTWLLRMMANLGGFFGVHSREVKLRRTWNDAFGAFIVRPTIVAAAEEIERAAPSARSSVEGLHTFGLVLDVIRLQDPSRGKADPAWKVETTFDKGLRGPDLGAVRRYLAPSPGTNPEQESPDAISAPPPLELLSRELLARDIGTQLLTLAPNLLQPTIAQSAFERIDLEAPSPTGIVVHLKLDAELTSAIKSLQSTGTDKNDDPICLSETHRDSLRTSLQNIHDIVGEHQYSDVVSSSERNIVEWTRLIERASVVDTLTVGSQAGDDGDPAGMEPVRNWKRLADQLSILAPKRPSADSGSPRLDPTRSTWESWLTEWLAEKRTHGFDRVLAAVDTVTVFKAACEDPVPDNWKPGELHSRLNELATDVSKKKNEIGSHIAATPGDNSVQEKLTRALAACMDSLEAARSDKLLAAYRDWLREDLDSVKVANIMERVSGAAKEPATVQQITWVLPRGLNGGESLQQFDAQQGSAILRDLARYPSPQSGVDDLWSDVRTAGQSYRDEFFAIWGDASTPMELVSAGCPANRDRKVVLSDLLERLSDRGKLRSSVIEDARYWVAQKKTAHASNEPAGTLSNEGLLEVKMLDRDDRKKILDAIDLLRSNLSKLPDRSGLRSVPQRRPEPGPNVKPALDRGWLQEATLDNLLYAMAESVNELLTCSLPGSPCEVPDNENRPSAPHPHKAADLKLATSYRYDQWLSILRGEELSDLDYALQKDTCLDAAKRTRDSKADYDWVEQWRLVAVEPGGALTGLGSLQGKALARDHFSIRLDIIDHNGTVAHSSTFDAFQFGPEGPKHLQAAAVELSRINSIHVQLIQLRDGELPNNAAVVIAPDPRLDDSSYHGPWAGVRLLRSACQVNAKECEIVVELKSMLGGRPVGSPAAVKLKFERSE